MISSDYLHFFNVLAKSDTLAECARKLDVTPPPAVTQRLRALEARIGIRLDSTAPAASSPLTDEGALVASHGTIVADAMRRFRKLVGTEESRERATLVGPPPHGFGRIPCGAGAGRVRKSAPRRDGYARRSDFPAPPDRTSTSSSTSAHRRPERDRDYAGPPTGASSAPARPPRRRPTHPKAIGPVSIGACSQGERRNVTLWRLDARFEGAGDGPLHPTLCSNDGAVVREWAIAARCRDPVGVEYCRRPPARRLQRVLPAWEVPAADVRHAGHAVRSKCAPTAFLAMLRHPSPAALAAKDGR